MPTVTTETIDDFDALAAIAPAWWELWLRTPSATPFSSPAWLIAWGREFAAASLCASAVFLGGRLAALAPAYLERSAETRLMPLGVSLSDYLDILIDPEHPEASNILSEMIGELRWDCCCFEELPPRALAAALPTPPGCEDRLDAHSACPTLVLRGGRDLAECAPARRRRQLRRALAAASRLGRVNIEAVQDDADRFLTTLFSLHETRWRERGEGGVLADERVRRFHREALPRLAAASLARCYVLTIGGRPAAAYYGFHDRARAFAYLGGFDPAFEEASPGAVILGHAIGEAIDEGAGEFHFLRGQEAYKYSWGAVDRWNDRRVWTRRRHE